MGENFGFCTVPYQSSRLPTNHHGPPWHRRPKAPELAATDGENLARRAASRAWAPRP